MPRQTLGELQLAIMRVLWRHAEATAAEVHDALFQERGLAPTTIATMLRKMEDKGVVTHRKAGRSFVYRAAVSEAEVHRSMVEELVDRLFAGDPTALLNHLVDEGDVDLAELEELRRRLGRGKRRRKGGGRREQ